MELVYDGTHRVKAQDVDVAVFGYETLNVLKTPEYLEFASPCIIIQFK
jgi:hypothetical protein